MLGDISYRYIHMATLKSEGKGRYMYMVIMSTSTSHLQLL